MPAIKRLNVATTDDALQGLKFKVQSRAALVSLWANGKTAGDTVSFSVGSRELLVNAAVNVEADAGEVDVQRDQVLFQERVPAGEYFIPISATTSASFLLVIEPVG